MKTNRIVCALLGLCWVLLAGSEGRAQTFNATNQPGTSRDFTFKIAKGTANFRVSVPGAAGKYSFLYLGRGTNVSETNFEYASALAAKTNYIILESAQVAVTNWTVRVSTPAVSAAHAYALTVKTAVTGLKSAAAAVSKPLSFTNSSSVPAKGWHYYRVFVPTNAAAPVSLKVTLGGGPANGLDLFVQKGAPPTSVNNFFLKRSQGQTNDVLPFSDLELTEGDYFIGVNNTTAAAVKYKLECLSLRVIPLVFDNGATLLGTQLFTNRTTNAADFYFKIRTVMPPEGAWRTMLTVKTNDANFYMRLGKIPTVNEAEFKSTRTNSSDGLVLANTQFAAGQDWYILVTVKANTEWSLGSGAPHVVDLGPLAADAASGTNVTVGVEGWSFFKTTMSPGTLAWRLWLQGGSNNLGTATNSLCVRSNLVPLDLNGTFDQKRAGQMLPVPPYFTIGQQLFVGVRGEPGSPLRLDSRQQMITDVGYGSTATNTATNFYYTTYRVPVPANQVAWEVTTRLQDSDDNPNFYLRQDFVANENNNHAYSEIVRQGVTNRLAGSLSLVPPGLSDGVFFVTVYAKAPFTLVNGPALVREIGFTDTLTNVETNRPGWAYFRISDIDAQVGALGWELELTNAPAGTRIAMRRNKAPGIWRLRPAGQEQEQLNYDFISRDNFLQIPGHQGDVWYVGVFNGTNDLGPFVLKARPLTAVNLSGDGETATVTNASQYRWNFYRMDVPAGDPEFLGWDLRLEGVTGVPKLAVRRGLLPVSSISNGQVTTNIASWSSPSSYGQTNWPDGTQWMAEQDWTLRRYSGTTNRVDQLGRILAMGMGRPLEPGTYYIGVFSTGTNCSYTLRSRHIGPGKSIPVKTVAFEGGASTLETLAPREAAYYKVNIPPGMRSWKVRLEARSGEAMMVVSTNRIPNVLSEKKMQKTGNEHFLLLPNLGQSTLPAISCYIAVVSEGIRTNLSNDQIGTNNATFVLTSQGEMAEPSLGQLAADGATALTVTNQLEGGEAAAYHFTPQPGTLGFSMNLVNIATATNIIKGTKTVKGSTNILKGLPCLVSRGETDLANPGAGGEAVPQDPYGNLGGQTAGIGVSYAVLNVADPYPVETVMMKARGADPKDARYRLEIRALTAANLAFDKSGAGLTNKLVIPAQAPTNWKFFKVEVPADALGWDCRITDVKSGTPRMVICRDYLPVKLATAWPGSSPYNDNSWTPGNIWAAGVDWTDRTRDAKGQDESGRILSMSMGHPLEPGTYYVGVQGASGTTTNLSYSIWSRGIGTNYTIGITELAYGDAVTGEKVTVREGRYYHMVVPTNQVAAKIRLGVTKPGEALLIAARGYVPNIGAQAGLPFGTIEGFGGKKNLKPGNEHYLLQPGEFQTELVPGHYYFGVIGQGLNATNSDRVGIGTTDFTLSAGSMAYQDLGDLNNLPEGQDSLIKSGTLEGGECVGFQFKVPEATLSMECSLTDRTGNPAMYLHAEPYVPHPDTATGDVGRENYGVDGYEGGTEHETSANTTYLTKTKPAPGTAYLVVKARKGTGDAFPNASYTLKIKALTAPDLNFDGGWANVTGQASKTWRYFRVEVPTNALGWDLRLTNVTAGLPRIVVCRASPPTGLRTEPWSTPTTAVDWPTNQTQIYQWSPAADWTKRGNDFTGVTNEQGRVFFAPMGRPLQPGLYFVGVSNSEGTNTMSYRIVSRGVGDGFTIPVLDLPMTGGVHTNTLLPREAAYYRLTIPPQTASFKMRVRGLGGDCLLVARSGFLPSFDAIGAGNALVSGGKSVQKSGDEHLLLLPTGSTTNLNVISNLYLAVVGEGVNPTNIARIARGECSFAVETYGSLVLPELGEVALGNDLVVSDTVPGGDEKGYRFTAPTNALGLEIRLENRVGNPVMVLGTNGLVPVNPGATVPGGVGDNYGVDGGSAALDGNLQLVTLPNSTNRFYHVMVKARPVNGVYPDAAYTLRVRILQPLDLNFGSHLNTNGLNNVVSSVLEDGQRTFYRVRVPNITNTAFLGWKLDAAQTSGLLNIRVRKGALPADNNGATSGSRNPSHYVVPPYLTEGDWYVEVKAQGSTAYTLTSNPILGERPAWDMPVLNGAVTTPGLTYPQFGDTEWGTNGIKLAELSGGVSLAQGQMHFYAVNVPTNNGGLMRVVLKAISGDPDFYLRREAAPTVTHGSGGGSGTITDRSMTGAGTHYGNWVVADGKAEIYLKPGRWYLAVLAAGASNVKYHLQLSVGNVQNVNFGSTLSDQVVAANDWRYYRLPVPATKPVKWKVTFSQVSGDVWMYLRDVVPPGNGNTATEYKDWASDNKFSGLANYDAPGTYNFATPPTRLGVDYYIGFRGNNKDSKFTFTVTKESSTAPDFAVLDFYQGRLTNAMAANAVATYRIAVPPEATRWKQIITNGNGLKFYLKQGSLPVRGNGDDWKLESGVNNTLSQAIATWPWIPNANYYLTITNTTASTLALNYLLDGKNALTEDEDNDQLPDAWEKQYFGNLNFRGTDDNDHDSFNNAAEYAAGTNPMDLSSYPGARSASRLLPGGLMMANLHVDETGQVKFTILGAGGQAVTVEAASDLTNWEDRQSLTLDGSGTATFTEEIGTAAGPRFYRVRSP